jgi:preprotein translocase subunit SecG
MVLFSRDSLLSLNKLRKHKGLCHCLVKSTRFVHFLFLTILVALACISSEKCWAGASASNWVVVVNADSLNSRTIANH